MNSYFLSSKINVQCQHHKTIISRPNEAVRQLLFPNLTQNGKPDKYKNLGDDSELEAGWMRRKQTEKNAASGGFLDGRRSPLAVLNFKKAWDRVNSNAGRQSHWAGKERQDEDQTNGGKQWLHVHGGENQATGRATTTTTVEFTEEKEGKKKKRREGIESQGSSSISKRQIRRPAGSS